MHAYVHASMHVEFISRKQRFNKMKLLKVYIIKLYVVYHLQIRFKITEQSMFGFTQKPARFLRSCNNFIILLSIVFDMKTLKKY